MIGGQMNAFEKYYMRYRDLLGDFMFPYSCIKSSSLSVWGGLDLDSDYDTG